MKLRIIPQRNSLSSNDDVVAFRENDYLVCFVKYFVLVVGYSTF